jgi:hypothetical protein
MQLALDAKALGLAIELKLVVPAMGFLIPVLYP